MRKNYLVALYLLTFSVTGVTELSAQEGKNDIIANVQEALKSSSSRELAKFLYNRVEIKLDDERKEYSLNQAEVVLKQFFQKNPSATTEFIHKGNSSGGIIYAIGSYKSRSVSYRVVIRARLYKNEYKVYRLEFTKER